MDFRCLSGALRRSLNRLFFWAAFTQFVSIGFASPSPSGSAVGSASPSPSSPVAEPPVFPAFSPGPTSSKIGSPSAEPAATGSASPAPSLSPPPSEASTATPETELPHPSGEEQQPLLRAKVLELAGAFTNDGYKIRDSFWLSKLPPLGQPAFLAVNLFAGNQYWFCVAIAPPAHRIVLKLYNEVGNLISTQAYEGNLTAALGVEPSESGKYYLSIELAEGLPANFCVLYTYK